MNRAICLTFAAAIALSAPACGGENNENAHTNNDNAHTNNDNAHTNNDNAHTNNDNAHTNNMTEFPTAPGLYAFESRFSPGVDSVAYDGQIARQVLISDIKKFIDGLTEAIDDASYTVGAEGSVVDSLDFYFRFDSDTYADEPHGVTTDPAPMQTTYGDISLGKDIVGKLAGNDSSTDHKDWSTEFGGWSDATFAAHGGAITSPEGFVLAMFEQIEANAIARADGVDRFAPDGTTVLPVHITEQGHDLGQLVQKFLTGAVSLSQGADDYLDDDTDGKGLLSSNAQDGDKPYTALEHQWDEGFGYWGASRYYLDLTDDEIASPGYKDVDGDGAIDLEREYNFGASGNAAKRDRGSATGTDLTTETFTAFWSGRYLLAEAGDELTPAELTELQGFRDAALLGWEKALAATVVHYMNDTITATNELDTVEYSFSNHAKVWSEMKGFAFAFQFNPYSPLSDADFDTLHGYLRDAPELTTAGATAYIADLEAARDLLADAYGFAAADVEAW